MDLHPFQVPDFVLLRVDVDLRRAEAAQRRRTFPVSVMLALLWHDNSPYVWSRVSDNFSANLYKVRDPILNLSKMAPFVNICQGES
jgi:hypothetical protein